MSNNNLQCVVCGTTLDTWGRHPNTINGQCPLTKSYSGGGTIVDTSSYTGGNYYNINNDITEIKDRLSKIEDTLEWIIKKLNLSFS